MIPYWESTSDVTDEEKDSYGNMCSMTCTNVNEKSVKGREIRTITLVKRIRPRDGLISAIISRSDKVIASDNLGSWSDTTSECWVSVINTSVDAEMYKMTSSIKITPHIPILMPCPVIPSACSRSTPYKGNRFL